MEKHFEILEHSRRVKAKVIMSKCLSSQLKPDGQTSSANQRQRECSSFIAFWDDEIKRCNEL